MKLRSLPIAVAAAAAVLVPTFAWTPAYADPPAAPGIDTLDSSVAGTVSGTVSSVDQPFVLVALVGATDSGEPTRTPVELAVSTTFSFTSWGYGSGTTVQAWACPTATFVEADCSAATVSTPFTPADVDPLQFLPNDTTVGPADEVSITPSDTGGGELFGQWDNGDDPLPARFAVAHSGKTVVPVADGDDGVVRLYRCDNTSQDHCVEEAGSPSATYQVRTTITAAVGTIAPVSSAHPTTAFDVNTDVLAPRGGSYTVTWHLEDADAPGTEIPGYGGSLSGGLNNGVAQLIPLDATDLPAGSYLVVGTITVVDSQFGTYTDVPMTSGTLTSNGDITPPAVTSIKASPTKIYPLISGNSTYKSTTKITVTGAGVPEIDHLVRIYQKTNGKLYRKLTLSQADLTHGTATWNGRKSDGTAVPAGTYLIKVRDAAGNVSPTVGQVSVSGHRLVSKTWTHTYTPASTLADKYVGKCSTLRQPSLRGWYHSFGYYANTRCGSTTAKDSLVSTLHAVFLPTAVEYTDIHVNAYGGAAKAKPGSKAVIRYLNTNGDWVSERTISSTLGTHAGYTRSTGALVFPDRSFGWGLYTGFGYQYDVKSFTVVLHYKVLG